MSAFLSNVSCFHSCRTCTDHKNFLLLICFFDLVRLYRWIHCTADRITEHDSCQAASTSDTWTDIICLSFCSFINKFTVTQVWTTDHADVGLSVSNKFFRYPWLVDSCNCRYRNVHMLSDLLTCMCMRCR